MGKMVARDAADAIGREERLLVEHAMEDADELFAPGDSEQAALAVSGGAHASHVGGEVGAVVYEPVKTLLKIGHLVEHFGFERLHGKQRDEADHGTQLHGDAFAVVEGEDVVEEAVGFIPERDTYLIGPHAVHGIGDVHEMVPVLAAYFPA